MLVESSNKRHFISIINMVRLQIFIKDECFDFCLKYIAADQCHLGVHSVWLFHILYI